MTVSESTLGQRGSRSDQVRARRARTTKKIERAAREIMPKQPQKRRARRRYDVSISEEMGTEFQLPAVPTVRVGSRLLSFALLAVSIWGVQRIVASDSFKVLRATTAGNVLMKSSQIRSLAAVEGQSVFLIDPQAVAARLEEEPEVKNAQVDIQWPNRVEIQIEEREPVIEWNNAGRIWWLSNDGIAYVQHGDRSNLVHIQAEEPVLNVDGDPTSPVVDPELLTAAAVLSERLPMSGDLIFNRERGLGFEDPEGWMAYFGTDGDMTMKTDVYLGIVAKLKEDNILATLVSVENQSAPYYKAESQFTWQQ